MRRGSFLPVSGPQGPLLCSSLRTADTDERCTRLRADLLLAWRVSVGASRRFVPPGLVRTSSVWLWWLRESIFIESLDDALPLFCDKGITRELEADGAGGEFRSIMTGLARRAGREGPAGDGADRGSTGDGASKCEA